MSDYIERDKIGLTDFEIAMCNGDYKEGLKMLLDKIESIPAADVRPVVRGRWSFDNIIFTDADGVSRSGMRGYKCSECDGFCIGESNYCPNCGAKMDTPDMDFRERGGDGE